LAFLPNVDPSVPNTVAGKRKSLAGSSSHLGSQAVREYQFLPEQPSDIYEKGSQPRFYDVPAEASNPGISSLHTGSRFVHGADQAPSYTFHGETGSSHLAQHGRSPGLTPASTNHEMDMSAPSRGQFGIPQIAGFENSLTPSEMGYHDEDAYRVDRKRKVCLHGYFKHSFSASFTFSCWYITSVLHYIQRTVEAKIAKEAEVHEKRIRKELEKQDLLNRKVFLS
jgi:hypothetical protein